MNSSDMFSFTLPKHEYGLHLEHNIYDGYESIEEYFCESGELISDLFVSEEQLEKALDTNELWDLTCYDKTPIGGYNLYAADLEPLFDEMVQLCGPAGKKLFVQLPRHDRLVLTHNEHKNTYETVEGYTSPITCHFITEHQKNVAIKKNELWAITWFTEGLEDGCTLYAADLNILLEATNEYDK